MNYTKPIPSHLLFTCHNKQALEESRRDTANYFDAHGYFEYEVITLMELAYILCIHSGRLDDDEIQARHNRLCKIVLENNLPYRHKDIRDNPYFRNAAFEYWVSPAIAIDLLKWHEGDKKLLQKYQTLNMKKDKKTRKRKFCPILLAFLKPFVDKNTSFKDFKEMIINNHCIPSGHEFDKTNPHEKCYRYEKASPNEIKFAYVVQNKSGNHDLYFYWNIPNTKYGEIHNDKRNLEKSVKRHYKYLENKNSRPLKPS